MSLLGKYSHEGNLSTVILKVLILFYMEHSCLAICYIKQSCPCLAWVLALVEMEIKSKTQISKGEKLKLEHQWKDKKGLQLNRTHLDMGVQPSTPTKTGGQPLKGQLEGWRGANHHFTPSITALESSWLRNGPFHRKGSSLSGGPSLGGLPPTPNSGDHRFQAMAGDFYQMSPQISHSCALSPEGR